MSVCICSLSIAPCFRNCKRRRGNFLHFGRSTKNTRRFWAKWRKIRASLRPWPPLGGGCRRSRLGERNYVLRLSLRRPAGDTSLTEGGKREGQSPSPTGGFTEVPPEIVSPSVALRATPPSQREANGRGRAPPLRAVLRKCLRKSSLPPSPCRRHLPHRGRQEKRAAGGGSFFASFITRITSAGG